MSPSASSSDPTPIVGRRLRTAVIGTGFVGPFHVDAVRRGGYADVVAICGSDPARTADRAADLGVATSTTDARRLFDDPSIDVVHICTPNASHVELALAALEAGKHIVVEKPVATTAADADRLASRAVELGRHGTVALTYRGYPMVRRARALVAAGELGELRLVHGAYIQDWLSDPGDYNWRVDPAISGESRAVADIGTHWFDTIEFISGLRVSAVMADTATFIRSRRRPLAGSVAFGASSSPSEEVAIDSEDAATILVRFDGGAIGTCVVSQVSPGRKNGFGLEVSGARATLDWSQEEPESLWLRTRAEARLLTRGLEDVPAGTAAGAAVPGVPPLPAGHPEGWADALRDLLRPFYAAIAAGAPPASGRATDAVPSGAYPTLADGARSIRFVEAVLRSAREGRWVELD